MKKHSKTIMTIIFLVFLILYPMRHIWWGGDLWDCGYNYANFRYTGIESIGKMWFFSTYLANWTGHLLTLLPLGHTVIGLNLYTGLFVSALAVLAYWFCTDELGIPAPLVFAGEVIAESFCWSPTALLYNYMTYLLVLACMILLYRGLTKGRMWALAGAGICLGVNVFVRFSNLPEMGLIAAVWGYSLLEVLDRKKETKEISGAEGESTKKENGIVAFFNTISKYTLWCLAGYLGALLVVLGLIGLRYGLDRYVEGISLLFGMTDVATDYKPTSMLYGLIWPFKQGIYWVARICLFVVAASLLGFSAGYAPLCCKKGREKWTKFFSAVSFLGTLLFMILLIYWLYMKRTEPRFTSFAYRSYDPIYWPGVMILLLAMVMGAVNILRPKCPRKEKLIGGMVILVCLLTSLGSNNGIMPSLNNLFVTAPYVLWQGMLFTRFAFKIGKKKPESFGEFYVNLRPAAAGLWSFLLVCTIQIVIFGVEFSFCEATGVQEIGYYVGNNEALHAISMSEERANWLGTITQYVKNEGLQGDEVILYGGIPALSFYLEMPPAFHAWCILDSFGYETMRETVDSLAAEMERGERRAPVVIADREYLEEKPDNPKWALLSDFMDKHGYHLAFINGKFSVWQQTEEQKQEAATESMEVVAFQKE